MSRAGVIAVTVFVVLAVLVIFNVIRVGIS
jgi:hypothetical protein